MEYENIENLSEICMKAIHEINPDDLAFLFATGKSELEIRTQIAIYLNRHRGSREIIAREWNRHDLAIIIDGEPTLLIEGKSWLHADVVKRSKLLKGSKSIKSGLEEDIKKLKLTHKNHPRVNCFISMINFSIDVNALDSKKHKNVHLKYEKTHRQGLKGYGSLSELASAGRSQVTELLNKYGNVKRTPILVSEYLNVGIIADFYLLQIDPNQ